MHHFQASPAEIQHALQWLQEHYPAPAEEAC
jgi:hypothetical protein